MNTSIIPKRKNSKAMATFTDDDGRVEFLSKWKPILEEKRNKLTVATITGKLEENDPNFISWEDVHRFKKEFGVEFVNHTHNHLHANLLTPEEIDYELRVAKEILKREGLTHDIIIQPYGENNEDVRRISCNYAKVNVSVRKGINMLPLEKFNLFRIWIGERINNTFEYYKSKVDEAVAKKGWVIFMTHSHYPSFDENQLQIIRRIIDYIREKNVEEVTLEEGLQKIESFVGVGMMEVK